MSEEFTPIGELTAVTGYRAIYKLDGARGFRMVPVVGFARCTYSNRSHFMGFVFTESALECVEDDTCFVGYVHPDETLRQAFNRCGHDIPKDTEKLMGVIKAYETEGIGGDVHVDKDDEG